jgi:hypothetical protein
MVTVVRCTPSRSASSSWVTGNGIAANPVARSQQPATHALLYVMHGIAGDQLLDLGQESVAVAEDHVADGFAVVCRFSEPRRGYVRRLHRKQYHGTAGRRLLRSRRRYPAVSAEDGDGAGDPRPVELTELTRHGDRVMTLWK